MKSRLCQIVALQLLLALRVWAGLEDGLAAYYDFESNLQDQSGHGRHLAGFGSPEAAWPGGIVTRAGSSATRSTLLAGKALNLVDADGDYLKAPLGSGPSATAAGSFNLGGNFTLSAWHFLAPLPANTSTRYFVFEGETNFDVSWGISSGDSFVSYNAQTAAATLELSRNAWHHVVHVFESVGDDILLTTYVNGARLGQTNADAAAMDFSRLVVGNSRDGQDRKWDGLLDEFAIWNRALTAQELEEVHARGANGFGVTEDLGASGAAYFNLTSAQPLLGTVTGSGLYQIGQQTAVTAAPSPGHVFVSWSGAFAGYPASFTSTVADSITATATFARDLSDHDGDGLSAYDEISIHGTDPSDADTDDDQLGDRIELETTGTSPTQTDAVLVNQAIAAFGPAATGAVALNGPSINRDPGTGETVLHLGFAVRSPAMPWQALPMIPSNFAPLPSGELGFTLPSPFPTTDIYELRGSLH